MTNAVTRVTTGSEARFRLSSPSFHSKSKLIYGSVETLSLAGIRRCRLRFPRLTTQSSLHWTVVSTILRFRRTSKRTILSSDRNYVRSLLAPVKERFGQFQDCADANQPALSWGEGLPWTVKLLRRLGFGQFRRSNAHGGERLPMRFRAKIGQHPCGHGSP